MEEKITNPHDKFFKEVLSNRENAKDFFTHYLPKEIAKLIDLNALEVQKDSFVEEDLKEFFSDMLYKINLGGYPGYIYILFEHKSYPERLIAFKLLRYLLKIWELHLKQQQNVSLPIIIPLVLYHGKESWSVGLRFSDILIGPKEELSAYIPDFSYLLYDLSQYTDEEIKGIITLKVTLLLLKYIFNPEFPIYLRKILPLLKGLFDKKTGLEYIEAVFRYIFSATDNITVEEIKVMVEESISKDKGGEIMSLAERLRQEGFQQGIKQGLLEAIELGLKLKFGTDGLKIYPEISRIDNVDTLKSIKEAIEIAKEIDEIKRFF